MLFNETCTLYGPARKTQDETGAFVDTEPLSKETFCNRFAVGSAMWQADLDLGVRADAEIRLRSCELCLDDGTDPVEVDFSGRRYTVAVSGSGEYATLTLSEKASNG